MKIKVLIMLVLVLFQSKAVAQSLANIESQRIKSGDKRFVLDGGFRFSYFNNNGNYWLNIGSGINAQFKNKDFNKIYLIIGSYNLARSKSEKFQDSWFLHFRFNYKIKKILESKPESRPLRFESFIQSSRNEQFIVNSRNLIGAGLRLKLILSEPTNKPKPDTSRFTGLSVPNEEPASTKGANRPTIILYLGSSYMYEEEKSDVFDTNFFNHRYSSYASLKVLVNDHFSIVSNTYYQPLFSNFKDYNFFEQIILSTKINEQLSFDTQFNYFHDNIIPGGGKYFTSSFSAGITIALEKVSWKK